VFESQEGIGLHIDKNSAPYLAGIEIDFVDNNMMGAGFAITNPNVKSSCGCGQSHQF
jgi:iron-sulfur cluster assembly protein